MLRHAKTRGILFQIVVMLSVLFVCYLLFHNTQQNLARQGIASGFSFLEHTAGFGIVMSLINYHEEMSYARVFLVGLLNTVLVSILGIIAATFLGFVAGLGRISKNYIIAKLSLAYVEIFRNIPLLLQIFFWYFGVLRALPAPRDSIEIFGLFFLNNRGLLLPEFSFTHGLSVPILTGFNFEGGIAIIPEFISLWIALTVYTGTFIAEIVRAGVLSVPKGQLEAAKDLGLSRIQTIRYILLPQAMRVAIPPLTNQYLNLTKNSSLAAAIAYPDLVSVFAGTVLNQTGQAVEVIFLTMSVYLFLSLSLSLIMNLYERRHEKWSKPR